MTGIQNLIAAVSGLISKALPIMVGIALLTFLWGLVKFISKSGDKNAAEDGRNIMTWGLVALFVMVSAWGLVNFLQNNLNLYDLSL